MVDNFNRPQVYISRKEDEEALKSDFLDSGYKSKSEYLYSLLMKGLKSKSDDASVKVVSTFQERIETIENTVKRLDSKMDEIQKTLGDYSMTFFDIISELNRLSDGQEGVSSEIKNFDFKMNGIRSEIKSLKETSDSMKSQLDSLKENIAPKKDESKENKSVIGRFLKR